MKRALIWLVVGITAGTVVLYWPAVHNGFTNWDDPMYLEWAQKYRLSGAGVWAAFSSAQLYYQPLTWLSHGLDVALWGMWPVGHHAQSVVWHALNAGLVVLVTWRLSKWAAPWSEVERLLLAGWVGLVFAVHPLQVEAVAWIAGRKTLVSGSFLLLAVLAYVHWAEDESRRRWWWIMVAGYGAALLTKPMALSLPVVLLALDLFPLRRVEKGWWEAVREKWLLWGAAVVVGVLTVVGQAGVGALTAVQLNFWERLLVAARGLVFYVWKLVWPEWLSPFYPLGEWNDWGQVEFVLPVIVCVIVTGAVVMTWRRAPQWAAAWGAYVALVAPVSGLFQAGGQAVADRFAYLPVLPALLLAGGGWLLWRGCSREVVRGLLLALLGGQVLWFCVRTREQISVWEDDVSLWRAVVRCYPVSPTEHRYLAQALVAKGQFDEALAVADVGYQQLPDDVESRQGLAAVYRDIAAAWVQSGKFARSLPVAQRAVELDGDEVVGRAALGLALLKLNQPAEAAEQLAEVVRRRADMPAARYNLACAYARLGRLEEAREALRLAMEKAPRYADLAARDPDLAALRN